MADEIVAPTPRRPGRVAEWLARTAVLGERQRAYGPKGRLANWIDRRGLQLLGSNRGHTRSASYTA